MKRRASVSHRAYPLPTHEDGEQRVCGFCRRAIVWAPGHQYQQDHWKHVPRPRVLSTSR